MNENTILAGIILFENSIFAATTASKKMLDSCSAKCQRGIKNGADFNFKVKVCTSTCKIRAYTKLIASLQALKRSSASHGVINKKISYFTAQLQNEKSKYAKYREQLKSRQRKIPVNQSLKPSPDRWNPRKMN